jgi:S1-C subfamily serine protease
MSVAIAGTRIPFFCPSRRTCRVVPRGISRQGVRTAVGAWLLVVFCLGSEVAAERKSPATVEELVEEAGRWIVALRVERTKDLPPARLPVRGLPPEMKSYYERPEAWVSGILVDAEGHVVTSAYNVAGEVKSIAVKLPGGDEHEARVVARSLPDDVALLKLTDAGELEGPTPFVEPEWADLSSLRAGRIVFAVGRAPDPAQLTVTRGILSAVTRNGGRSVQTDAELNYGNVGGPILDLKGRIVGMACFVGHVRPQWGVNSGVGFATKGIAIRDMLPELRKGKDYNPFKFPLLGIRGDRDFVDIPTRGARVESVLDNGPASRAGVEKGDVIVAFRGARVKSFDHLRRLIFGCGVGEKVKLEVKRGEETLELEVVLGEIQ